MKRWEMIKLGDLLKITSGGTPSREKPEYYEGGNIPWVKTGDLKTVEIHKASEFITKEALANSSAKLFPPNTVLIAMYGATIGACSILKIEAATNQACAALLPNEKINERFLFYFLASIKDELISLGVGGAQPNISGGILKNIEIPLPPISEQKRIARILDAADRLRQQDKALIGCYNQLAQSVFLEIFGDPVRNERGWDVKEFQSVVASDCPLSYGIVQPGDEMDEGVPIVRPVDLTEKFIKIEKLKRILPEISASFSRTLLQGHELLLSVRGSVGIVSFATKELKGANVTRGIVPIWTNELLVLSSFVYSLFKTDHFLEHLKGMSKGATLLQINLKDVREMKIPIPPLPLQQKFAEVIENIEHQKAQAEASGKESEGLFQSLLKAAFKGEL